MSNHVTIKSVTKSAIKLIKIVLYAPLFVVWYIVVQVLPYKVQMNIGEMIGKIAQKFSHKRRVIAATNITRCFPELSQEEQKRILDASMISLGKGFMESGIAWFWPSCRLKHLCRIKGLKHLDEAKKEHHGVLFLAIHFTPIEICAALINMQISIDGFYRPHKNPIYEFIQCRGRTCRNKDSKVIPKNDTRGIVRALRNERVVNYAVDQDFGRHHSIFTPFFGISTATVTAPLLLAKLGNALVIPYTTKRIDGDKGYEVEIYPRLDINSSDDQQHNMCLINRFIEARIRENPEQYLWVHRRFKTRPVGEKTFYNFSCSRASAPDTGRS